MKCPKCSNEMQEKLVCTVGIACCGEQSRQAHADLQAAEEAGRTVHVDMGTSYTIVPLNANRTPHHADCFFCEPCILVVVPAAPGWGRDG